MFYDDKDRPNRYLLAKELVSRPNADDLEVRYKETFSELFTPDDFIDYDYLQCFLFHFLFLWQIIFGEVEGKSDEGPSLFSQAASIFSSLNRFMKAISK